MAVALSPLGKEDMKFTIPAFLDLNFLHLQLILDVFTVESLIY